MSRTIRRKGWHVTTSAKWHAQKNNPFAYIRKYKHHTKVQSEQYVQACVDENMERPLELASMMKERHRDSFWKTLRWKRYASPIPRVFHKMEIKHSLRSDTDYKWDEKAARQYEKGLSQMLWD